jgi:glucarate dehydratase
VKIDEDALAEAAELYARNALGGRDDAVAMRKLVADWKFDAKRPALAR